MIDREFLDRLKPIEIEFISSYILGLSKQKITEKTTNEENLEIRCCPLCGSPDLVRNGRSVTGRQKYRCKDCKKIFLNTTDSFFSHTRISYNDWKNFIAAEINGMTLQQESVQIARSVTTCFHMRHKLYKAVERYNERELSGNIECDPTYEKISLKGTKKKDMPRFSKQRGKSNSGNHKRGITNHDVCILTAVDENDNILYKIIGLGEESEDKLTPFVSYFRKGSTLITDGKACLKNFAVHNGMESDRIPKTGGKKHYRTKEGNSLSSVNQLHQELEILKYRCRGISTRHLPEYLNWIVFLKHLRYSFEAKNRRTEAYIEVLNKHKGFRNKDICSLPMPVDLYKAYGEYHYGIYADQEKETNQPKV